MLILKSHNFQLVCPTPVAKLATPAKQQIVARTSVLISLVNIYFACIHKTLLERPCIHRTDCGFIFLPAIKQHCSCTDLLAFNIHSVEASTDSNKAQEILWEVLHKTKIVTKHLRLYRLTTQLLLHGVLCEQYFSTFFKSSLKQLVL